MRSYRYFQLDVFTDQPFGGNQLAVFLDGRGLTSDQMQTIAREMNFSETTFLLPAEQAGTDARLRIFTPGAELPMAGHPTVGSAFALARAGALAPGRERYVFGLGIGPTPLGLSWHDGELSFVWMTQPLPSYSAPLDPSSAADALGLPATAVAGTGLPVQVLSSGAPFLFVPIATRRAVDSASLDRAAFHRLLASHHVEANGVFLFSPERGTDRATVYSRMFAPDLGVPEDPATGSASGPLGCYLVRHKVVPPEHAGTILSVQGVAMRRPSYVHVAVGLDGGEIASVQVGGEAVTVGEGTIFLA